MAANSYKHNLPSQQPVKACLAYWIENIILPYMFVSFFYSTVGICFNPQSVIKQSLTMSGNRRIHSSCQWGYRFLSASTAV